MSFFISLMVLIVFIYIMIESFECNSSKLFWRIVSGIGVIFSIVFVLKYFTETTWPMFWWNLCGYSSGKEEELIISTPVLTGEWLGFFGNFFGALVGGVITLYVMHKTLKETEKQHKEAMRIQVFPWMSIEEAQEKDVQDGGKLNEFSMEWRKKFLDFDKYEFPEKMTAYSCNSSLAFLHTCQKEKNAQLYGKLFVNQLFKIKNEGEGISKNLKILLCYNNEIKEPVLIDTFSDGQPIIWRHGEYRIYNLMILVNNIPLSEYSKYHGGCSYSLINNCDTDLSLILEYNDLLSNTIQQKIDFELTFSCGTSNGSMQLKNVGTPNYINIK